MFILTLRNYLVRNYLELHHESNDRPHLSWNEAVLVKNRREFVNLDLC